MSLFHLLVWSGSRRDRWVKPLVGGFTTKITRSARGFTCLSTRPEVDLSSSHLRFLTARIRERRHVIGSRWRRLSADRQALLTLAHLCNGHPYAQLAAGFGIGTTTAYRYRAEAVDLLAALAPTLEQAVREASRLVSFWPTFSCALW